MRSMASSTPASCSTRATSAGGGRAGARSSSSAERLELFVRALDAIGCEPAVVSGGSTPTLWRSHEIPGLTEIRPGTNIFNDRTTAVIGAASWDECAYSVLATVVSTAVPGQAVIDAGAKALGRRSCAARERATEPSSTTPRSW
jgi:D-serine deaminase-like pyridoxal phosphate-dependent protein